MELKYLVELGRTWGCPSGEKTSERGHSFHQNAVASGFGMFWAGFRGRFQIKLRKVPDSEGPERSRQKSCFMNEVSNILLSLLGMPLEG